MAERPLSSAAELTALLHRIPPREVAYATQFVDMLLTAAISRQASDIHLTPVAEGLDLRWRVDGVLEPVGVFSRGEGSDVVTRLKVLADLLTYRQETPQEGRLKSPRADVEMRVSTFPTLFGERAVVRLFRRAGEQWTLAELGLPTDLSAALAGNLEETGGAILVTGPAGSGKTTTVYACLREILGGGLTRSIVTLEDPIETVLPGAAQSAIQPAAGFDFATALRSLMRQDPEVILVGEVRDRETAVAAFQAALTGHLVLSTFHAGSVCTAVSRLNDMGIEPYLLRSGIQGLMGQRLVRRLCECAVETDDPGMRLGLRVERFRLAQGCAKCGHTGFSGRLLLAEMLPPLVGELGAAVLARADARHLERLAQAAGMIPLWQRGEEAVRAGATSPQEICRVLGFGDVLAADEP